MKLKENKKVVTDEFEDKNIWHINKVDSAYENVFGEVEKEGSHEGWAAR